MPELLERVRSGLAARYAIEHEIGRGGMAVVYRARDLRHGRPVAIKVFHTGVAGHADAAARFLQEIRIAARLAHPHVLPLHDSGEIAAADGAPALLYYVMPFVTGRSLRERLRDSGPLPVDEAVAMARTVASALDHAHRKGVLHRDVKPENILLQEGEAVVADFGVARALEATGSETQTLPGLALGTPAYMSPEQASGDERVDARSDEYALACVVYEMLAGVPPFTGGGVRAVMSRHAVEPAPSVRAVRPEVPLAVERAVARALAKDPEARFASVAEFAEALSGSLSEPGLPALETRAARSIAVLPFVNASPDPDNDYFGHGMTDELIHVLAQIDGLRVASRTAVFGLPAGLDAPAVGARLGVATVLEGSVRKAGQRLRITAQLSDASDGRLLWSERFDRDDRDVFAIQEDLARTIVATLRADLLGTLEDPVPRRYTENLAAYTAYLRGRHRWNQRTPHGITAAIAYFERAIAEDPGYALAYTGLADAYALQLDYRAAPVAEGMRRAKEMAHRALALDDHLAEAHTSLAWVSFIYDWDWPAAEREFRRAIDCNPRYATARQWYSWYLAAIGRMEEALAEGRRAASLDTGSASVQRSLGWLHYFARQPDRAVAQLRRALQLDPESNETHLILALAAMQGSDLEGAGIALGEALTLAPADTAALAAQARLAMLRGQPAEAAAVAATMEALARERYVSPTDFAKLHLARGDFDRAFAAIEAAHAEHRGWLAYLRVEPLLDPVRDDPRYLRLLERMHLDRVT
jgi:serine/threonine-protein kinase